MTTLKCTYTLDKSYYSKMYKQVLCTPQPPRDSDFGGPWHYNYPSPSNYLAIMSFITLEIRILLTY